MVGLVILVYIISTISICADAISVQEQFTREIGVLEKSYQEAYEKGEISEDLYDEVKSFLEKERKLSLQDYVEAYNQFPENYTGLLQRYSEEELNNLGDKLQEENHVLGAVEKHKELYNADMYYIEKELAIYGIEADLVFTEEDFIENFPILTAEG